MNARDDVPENNRTKKVKGRAKRRRFVQGTRTYLHAMTNSVARRAAAKKRKNVTG
jgi:hypothetical protein